ncbi:PREDICTED: UDP-glucuronosyltransferase 2B13-like, partial [Nicrophorus vespilloides]|uniref:UDP-glucuronosyltransferase n=1 Tax=Nicrophorus vespilloides TaxID=110193 RepID=A0ABM1MLZ4_NICVS
LDSEVRSCFGFADSGIPQGDGERLGIADSGVVECDELGFGWIGFDPPPSHPGLQGAAAVLELPDSDGGDSTSDTSHCYHWSIHSNETTKDLPKDLKLFLDEAKEGVIYFSLGSNVKSKDIPEETRDIIMKTFAKLPYKILWKFEAENLPGKPDNVKIVKWIPQQDVLSHKNIKLFISQCGLQSLEESLYNYVPVLGLPFFGDQSSNAFKLESNGLGLFLEYKELRSRNLHLVSTR